MLINAPEGWTATDDKLTVTDDKPTIILAYLKPTQTKTYLYKLLQEGKIVAHGANKNRTYSLA